jgi:hypothetical protein
MNSRRAVAIRSGLYAAWRLAAGRPGAGVPPDSRKGGGTPGPPALGVEAREPFCPHLRSAIPPETELKV